MDSKNKDTSPERNREEMLARRVGEALDQLAPTDAGKCPDAELFAAYHERTLQPQEITLWESHFASCSRCRKILAVLAASVDAPLAEKEVAQLGVLAASVGVPSEAAPRTVRSIRPNRAEWRARWLAPALGIAAVLTVWFVMRPPWRTPDQATSGTLIAQAPRNENTEAPLQDEPSKVVPKQNAELDATSRKDQSATNAQLPNSVADSLAKKRLDGGSAAGGIASSARVGEGQLETEKRGKTEANDSVASAQGVSPQPPLLPRPQTQVAAPAPAAPQGPISTNESVTATAEAPAVAATTRGATNAPARDRQIVGGQRPADNKSAAQPSAEAPLNGRNFRALSALGGTQGSTIQIKAPSGTTLWRVGSGGSIQRSTDGGSTWISQQTPSGEDWLAGAANSETVCWLVGRNGSIARTTNGERWEKIAPPALPANAEGKPTDWVNVTARDANSATITSSDQRRYATQDGGKTWQAQ